VSEGVIGFDKIFYLTDKNLLMNKPPPRKQQVYLNVSVISNVKTILDEVDSSKPSIAYRLEGVQGNLLGNPPKRSDPTQSDQARDNSKLQSVNHFPESALSDEDKENVPMKDNGSSKKNPKSKAGKRQHRNYTSQPKGYRDDENPMNFLHVRLGHLSDDYIKKMFKRGMITYLPYYNYESIKNWNSSPCRWCNLTKMTKIPSLPTGHDIRDIKPMEVICSDIIGKLQTFSRRNEHFIVFYVDLRTGYIMTYPIKKKSEVITTINRMLKENVDRYGHKCVKLHSDFDTVYKGENVKKFLHDRDIESTFSAPYHHQANGTAERSVRKLLDLARTLKIEANAPLLDTDLYIAMAAWLLNRTPNNKLDDCTPYESVTGRKPDMRH
jgi:transposase InsO family protein